MKHSCITALFAIPITIIITVVMIMMVTSSCTYSMNMLHTDGTADDLIDETNTPTTTATPTVTIPAAAL